MIVVVVLYLAVIAVSIISMWKVFEKAGKPGWAAIVPIYNGMVLAEIVGKPNWWGLLMLIPFVNFVVAIILLLGLATVFGKSTGFAVGLILLGFVFVPILAFGDAQYLGAGAAQQRGFAPVMASR